MPGTVYDVLTDQPVGEAQAFPAGGGGPLRPRAPAALHHPRTLRGMNGLIIRPLSRGLIREDGDFSREARTFFKARTSDNRRYAVELYAAGGRGLATLMLNPPPWGPVIVDFSMEDAYDIDHYHDGGLSRERGCKFPCSYHYPP
jgi:hypothetical protein